ncbi:MmcQ/YjbR family DNA-binding protein [Silvimonas soli]|uniref:MmcQ/YjbR family DNA-binding protein n=1 Tax=Silvimonas soli TaxID=2980100 RepID=UPI0024B3548D|nr:MmcQ/YjbR family DNA-binding protein [Silvimonas soli]
MNTAQFQALCAALPGVTFDVKWQTSQVYSIGGKTFAMVREAGGVAFKVEAERFLELTDYPGVCPAPYLARHRWIALDAPTVLPDTLLAELIQTSYRLVRAKLPAALRRSLP